MVLHGGELIGLDQDNSGLVGLGGRNRSNRVVTSPKVIRDQGLHAVYVLLDEPLTCFRAGCYIDSC